ncbi:protein ALTERED XYLOGLUCAN 4-like, partial [Amborella trichopoda]|uniref:protein ALTERED XYLOGLUCAN 4-like n=1 Tax=Amborella trichopoda TaxID=13333 RepID=UPI0009BE8649
NGTTCSTIKENQNNMAIGRPDTGYRHWKKFRRWLFNFYNLAISIYWSPFLVHGDEKSSAFNYNKLYQHKVDEQLLNEFDQIHMV